ncbi:hypothetical protein C8Q74DRAFT_779381 [Fomes fomentarius]|nr:hypothetical protein C8Q74DRAFT_779381 [Fomes fomentarius]
MRTTGRSRVIESSPLPQPSPASPSPLLPAPILHPSFPSDVCIFDSPLFHPNLRPRPRGPSILFCDPLIPHDRHLPSPASASVSPALLFRSPPSQPYVHSPSRHITLNVSPTSLINRPTSSIFCSSHHPRSSAGDSEPGFGPSLSQCLLQPYYILMYTIYIILVHPTGAYMMVRLSATPCPCLSQVHSGAFGYLNHTLIVCRAKS